MTLNQREWHHERRADRDVVQHCADDRRREGALLEQPEVDNRIRDAQLDRHPRRQDRRAEPYARQCRDGRPAHAWPWLSPSNSSATPGT
jgi:hypothetical protein